ncbi:MAG: SWIM zinc finger family protein [Deltaproteobacteria bacterium]|nr:MAG: SWIM zinc finger family protein [Deltaproteobacteria bacterium]TMQ23635.1 MAG: SWIM zinc finger family protein [Deltaproteobacteria bacterium]
MTTSIVLDYDAASFVEAGTLALAADRARPVRFHATVARGILPVRLALQTLGELVWRTSEWVSRDDYIASILDPICTVHPDRVMFEAFSADQSAYGIAIIDRALFSPIGEVVTGTTNVDFTRWLWSALAEMRSSRETTFRIGADGLAVQTRGEVGGRFEEKVDVPDAWVRGFLQLQGAMAMPGTRLSVRPVDLLAAIRFLAVTRARVSPRAVRWEMTPGEDAQLVLEPWEHAIRLRGAEHAYTEKRSIRTWGRRGLSLIEPLLPYADRVDVYLKGRALPTFYAVKLPGVTFVLGLSGWTAQRWTAGASFDLLVAPARDHDRRVIEALVRRYHATAAELASELGIAPAAAVQELSALCAEGRALFDVETRGYRRRELFARPIDLAAIYPPDPRREAAAALVAGGRVAIASAVPRETRKRRRLKSPDGPVVREVIVRDWVVQGAAGDQDGVEIVLSDEDRMIFGRCGCAFFQEHILNQGPCEHLLALLLVAQPARQDAASSKLVPPSPPDRVDGDEESDDDA